MKNPNPHRAPNSPPPAHPTVPQAEPKSSFGWKGAQAVADKLYAELVAEFQPGGVRMILRALRRRLDREEKSKLQPPPGN
jgi:hypothetical protein